MHPTESRMHKLVKALRKAEDELFAVEQGYVAASDMHKAIASNLREQVFDLMHKMQHFYYPDEEPTWDYDANNTYVESTAYDLEWFFCHHRDGTAIFKFQLRQVDEAAWVVDKAVPLVPFASMHHLTMEALVVEHLPGVIPAEEE